MARPKNTRIRARQAVFKHFPQLKGSELGEMISAALENAYLQGKKDALSEMMRSFGVIGGGK